MKTWHYLAILFVACLTLAFLLGRTTKHCPEIKCPEPHQIDTTPSDTIQSLIAKIEQLKQQIKNTKHEIKIIYITDTLRPDTNNIPFVFREWANHYR